MPDALSRSSATLIEQEARDPDETLATVREERNFLAARLFDGSYFWVGRSSDAMTSHAMFGNAIPPHEFPHDWGDYARCVNTYHRAPEHLRPAMLRVLAIYRPHVVEYTKDWKDHEMPTWMETDPVA